MVLRRDTLRAAKIAAVLILLCSGGCRLPSRVSLDDGGHTNYDRASIAYQIDGAKRRIPLRASSVNTVAFNEYDTATTSAKVDSGTDESNSIWKSAQLSIEYPHPEELPGMARASLRLSARSSLSENNVATGAERSLASQLLRKVGLDADTSSANQKMCDDELWVLDLPKAQLDLLLGDLSAGGFFEPQTRPNAGTHLDIRVNHGRTEKAWSPEPRLDDFVMRVYREGRLRGFVPCNQDSAYCPATSGFPTLAQNDVKE